MSRLASPGFFSVSFMPINTTNSISPSHSHSQPEILISILRIILVRTIFNSVQFYFRPRQEIKQNLDGARAALSAMRLEPKCRQQLQLLLQRQHLEEEELRLRQYMELEKFQKNLDASEWHICCIFILPENFTYIDNNISTFLSLSIRHAAPPSHAIDRNRCDRCPAAVRLKHIATGERLAAAAAGRTERQHQQHNRR